MTYFIAHRGESADAPENTLAAFRLAWERGGTAVELDVHLTSDAQLIVSHDANTRRTTGRDLEIANATAGELQALDAGVWKGPQWRGERMPLLGEALETIPPTGRCLIEVKVGPVAVPELARVVRASRLEPEQLAIISFNPDTIAEAHRTIPHVDAFLLSGFRRDAATGEWSPSAHALIREAMRIGACALNLAAEGPVDAGFVRTVKSAGLGVYAWTVDDYEVASSLIGTGVEGITSNRAAWLSDQFTEK